jgi:hypothetical protein
MATSADVKNGVMLVVGFMLTVLLAAELLPTAFNAWFNTSTGTWGGATAALWPLVPLFAIVGIILYYVGQAFDLI